LKQRRKSAETSDPATQARGDLPRMGHPDRTEPLQPRAEGAGGAARCELGPFVLDPVAGVLLRGGQPTELGARAVAVLRALVESADRYLPKEHILDAAWPGLVVEESNLSVQISAIRRVLATAPGGESWLQTLSRRGYRYVGPVAIHMATSTPATAPPALSSAPAPVLPRTDLAASPTSFAGGREVLAEIEDVAWGQCADFPPLASQTGHSLPAERDAFVGRREALAELARRLEVGARLISVLGLGGAGKTRLVTRFGWDALGEHPGGVWFCDLSEARSLDGILYAVAQGLGVPLGKDDPVTQLGHAIAGRGKCLVILDNFEQVARHAEETLGRWLNRASAARFLVTTREVLGLPGEEVMALAPLAPSEATALFLRRAAAAKPGFEPSGADQVAIAPLMKLLEGLPLAIELAAARVRVMPPRTLLQRMSERFKLLSSTGGRVGRQTTLRAVFDWSWDLLPLTEKAALAQLSVFEGGFTLESVEAILDLSAYENPPWPMDALQSLVQKSLVRQVADNRFGLQVSVQEYAAEHLRAAARYTGSGPAALLAAEMRHGEYFAGMDEKAAVAGGCAELDNLVAACRRAAARGDIDIAVRSLEGAWAGLGLRGPFRLAVELVSLVQAMPEVRTAALARVDYVAGGALASSGRRPEARIRLEASLSRAREVGDRRCECRALVGLGWGDFEEGRLESAHAYVVAALAIARELNDSSIQGSAYNLLGSLDSLQGWREQALAHCEAALALAQAAGDRNLEGAVLGNLATEYHTMGIMDKARLRHEAALGVAREVGNRRLEGNTLCNLGMLHQVQGQFGEALDRLESALAVAREMGDPNLECVALCNLGMVFENLARFDGARDHFEAALVIARELGDRRREGQFLTYLGLLHAHRAKFDEARQCLDAGEALLNAVADRESLGILLCSRAEAEHLMGAPRAANTALAAADVIAAELRAGQESELGLGLARVRDLLGHSQDSSVDGPIA